MVFALSAEAAAAGYRLETYELVDSTNNLAAEFARSGDKGRLWVAAEQQTSGRGRRGRVWQSPKGNLYATLLLCEDLTAEQTAMLGFVAGLALYEALGAVLPEGKAQNAEIKLKWPNDVLAGQAKCAGILPEFIQLSKRRADFKAEAAPKPGAGKEARQAAASAALIGIGVNIAAAPLHACSKAPAETGKDAAQSAAPPNAAPFYPAIALQNLASGEETEALRGCLFQALSRRWLTNYALWDKGRGMAAIREKWLRCAAYQGEMLHLIRNKRRLDGIFETIDEKGQLVLRLKNGAREYISAGDVYFGSVASAAVRG